MLTPFERYFHYHLPPERIAQRPSGYKGERSDSRLLHAHFRKGDDCQLVADSDLFSDRKVVELPEILRRGDLLLLNNSQVVPCRFFIGDAGSPRELFFLKRIAAAEEGSSTRDGQNVGGVWECLARPMRRFKPGAKFTLSNREKLEAEVLGRDASGERLLVRVTSTDDNLVNSEIESRLSAAGSMPIPPYIRGGVADDSDRELYQTVLASESGSIAAPTAGLHFTPELLQEIESKGVEVKTVTLHVGLASLQQVDFSPTSVAPPVPVERFKVSPETFASIAAAKSEGRRVIGVGTTVTRALESMAQMGGEFVPGAWHDATIFITPGYKFQVIDLLMTNFHQPGTTHLLLVAALLGEVATARLYEHALQGDYRFLSYGDSVLIEPL